MLNNSKKVGAKKEREGEREERQREKKIEQTRPVHSMNSKVVEFC